MATGDAPDAQTYPPQQAVFADCLVGILGTGRREAAGRRQDPRQRELVNSN